MSNSCTVEVKINENSLRDIKLTVLDALYLTMEALHTDLVQSQTMPFDTGTMQNESTSVEKGDNKVSLHTNTPYARRLYYHPEYNFSKKENPNAQAYWLQTYIDGDKKDFAKDTFIKFIEEGLQ